MAYKRRRPNHKKMLRKVRRRLNFGPPKSRKRMTARRVKKIIRRTQETKCVSDGIIEATAGTVATAAYIKRNLFAPTQGDNSDQRHGRKVTLTGIHIKGQVHNNGNRTNYVRILLLAHKDNSWTGAPNSTMELFVGPDNQVRTLGNVAMMEKMLYPINKYRFYPLYDKIMKLEGKMGNSVHTSKASRMFVIKKKMNKAVWFDEAPSQVINGVEMQDNAKEVGEYNQNIHYTLMVLAADSQNDTIIGENVELSYFRQFWFTDA